jgi:hypothetical protein
VLPRPTMDNLVVAFRFASLTALAGAMDNRQADPQVTHSLPARLASGLTRRYAPCLNLEIIATLQNATIWQQFCDARAPLAGLTLIMAG